jgi:cell division protein FtsW
MSCEGYRYQRVAIYESKRYAKMSMRTSLNSNLTDMTRPATDTRHSIRLHVDVPMVLVIITLLIFGMLMVYSASWDYSYQYYGSSTAVFKRQSMFLGAGCLVVLFLAWMDYHFWRKLAVPAMGAAVAGLVAVLLVGDVRNGAVRALNNGSVQPSELAKLVIVIYLAVWLYAKREKLSDVSFGLIPLAVILGLIGGLIYKQPDISAVLTIMLLGGLMFFLAGGDLRQILVVMILGIAVGWLVVQSGGTHGTGSERLRSFTDGLKNPLNASYHVSRSLEAFAKGGMFGVGIGNASTKLTGLPVPHTDSIFAVVGEETGFVGSFFLVTMYGLFLWRGLLIAKRAPDGLGRLLAAGLTFWLAIEAFINMAVMVGLMPFAGNALPFISAGGSNLMVSMAAIGILFNISRQSEKTVEQEGRTFGEVVDMRWRDRRRRQSRSRRSPQP